MSDEFEIEPVPCRVIKEYPKAYLLRDTENDNHEDAWVLKTQVDFEIRNEKTGICIALIPRWLLKEIKWND